MVDRDLILRKIADIDLYLEQVRSYRDIELDTYRADWKTQRIVERTLHLVIEACMDVADHIVADRRLRVPDSGAATFEVLAEAGVLPLPLANALSRMVASETSSCTITRESIPLSCLAQSAPMSATSRNSETLS